jgi:hypothetical protein
MALSRAAKRLMRPRGVTPLMYQYGETAALVSGEKGLIDTFSGLAAFPTFFIPLALRPKSRGSARL